jgi:LuxR family maltose regulon positive regulatory protein
VDGRPLLREAINLAQSHGLGRTLADADPALADWAQRVAEADGKAAGGDTGVPFARIVRPPREPAAGAPRAVPSMVLTPKERSVLELLARNLSNKEIAQAMSVGEETVKWHLKNLFGKLGAGTRKHVVRRAQLLGLLEETE